MRCRDAMTRAVVGCSVEEPMDACARKMRDHGVGFLPVFEGDDAVGVVTDRDLVVRGLAVKRPITAPVGEVMTAEPLTCDADEDAAAAQRRMAQGGVSRLLVLDGDRVVGVLALADIARASDPTTVGVTLRALRNAQQECHVPVVDKCIAGRR